MKDIVEKLKHFQEVKAKLKEIEQDAYDKKWEYSCATCFENTLVFHDVSLYPNEIRFYCKTCISAAGIHEEDKQDFEKYILNQLGIQWALNFDFIVDILDGYE
ncbi:MAG: hypothetical protein GY757_34680 [bacterium]|nr:hypothetical protein [bacterium]